MRRRKFLETGTLLPFLATGILKPENAQAAASTETFGSDEEREFFYRPAGAWAADFIPFFAKGTFQLFYLLDWRNAAAKGEGTPWYRISSKDFVNFTEHGEMLKRGTKEEQDLYVFTGCVIEAEGKYHIFYTGNNNYLRQKGKPEQGIMHAVSPDLEKWTKIPEDVFFAPAEIYEKNDWRDPFVFWNEEDKAWNMLLAARNTKGISRRRGLTALCTSANLKDWKVAEAFYDPELYFTHECPDLFKMGDWWYLIFSEFTDKVRTRYRMSRSLKGPWITPPRDDFDGHAFYAAKSASDGQRRFLFGWNPTRDGNTDNGGWQWGGNLAVHELSQESDGALKVDMPATVADAFKNKQKVVFKNGAGQFSQKGSELTLLSRGKFSCSSAGLLPALCRITATARFSKDTLGFGLMFRTSEDFEQSYYIRLEPLEQRLVFEKWPRERTEVYQMVELERPLKMSFDKPVTINAIIEGNKGVVYVNKAIAMNFRCYDLKEGNWGFFATGGNTTFSEIALLTR